MPRGRFGFKYPPGLSEGLRVVANARHDNAHRLTEKRRRGTVVSPTTIPNTVRVHWDGCAYPHEVDCRFFDIAEKDGEQ